MRDDASEPMDSELQRFVAAERGEPDDLPAAMKERLRARIEATLGAGPPTGQGPVSPGATGLGRLVGPAAATVLTLGAVGTGAYLLANRGQPPALPARPVVEQVAPSPTPDLERPPAVESVLEAPPSARQPAPHKKADNRDLDLARERAILDAARAAWAAGRLGAAEAELGRHRKEFPSGRLGEEREALTIVVLAAAHRGDEAKRRGERFRQKYPGSLLLPTVEAALKRLP